MHSAISGCGDRHEILTGRTWHGKANRLSREHGVHWDIIDEVAEASWKVQVRDSDDSRLVIRSSRPSRTSLRSYDRHGVLAGQIIRQRRSAVSFDGKTSITAATFFRMLAAGHAACRACRNWSGRCRGMSGRMIRRSIC